MVGYRNRVEKPPDIAGHAHGRAVIFCSSRCQGNRKLVDMEKLVRKAYDKKKFRRSSQKSLSTIDANDRTARVFSPRTLKRCGQK